MNTFKMKFAALSIALLAFAIPANAQVIVDTCGTVATTLTPGPGPGSLYIDKNGNLCTDVAVTIGDANIVKWGGVDVGAMANYGTSPGAVKAPGVNAFVTNFGNGVAGTPAGGVASVQGVASMTPFLVNPGTAADWNTSWAGGVLGAMANYGTSPGAVLVPGVNANVTNTVTTQLNGLSFTNIKTDTDTVIKAAAGVFAGLIVNTAGLTSAVVVYDNTTCTGTIIGTFSTLAQGAIAPIGAAAATGICATTTGGTPADITVLWR